MIQYKKLMMTLALLLTAASGAWADEVATDNIVINDAEIYIGQNTQMSATITPSNASNKTLTWKVYPGSLEWPIMDEFKGMAEIDENGVLTPLKYGLITVEVTNGEKTVRKETVVGAAQFEVNITGVPQDAQVFVGNDAYEDGVLSVYTKDDYDNMQNTSQEQPVGSVKATIIPDYFYTITVDKKKKVIDVIYEEATFVWSFAMPASNVVLTPEYALTAVFATDGNQTLAPAAAEGVIAGTDAPLIKEGTGTVAFAGQSTEVRQGQVMYAIGTATEAPALSAFSATVPKASDIPNADDGAEVKVWYYIQGADTPDGQTPTKDNTFNNSDVCSTPLTVTVLSNKFDLTLKAANANTIESGKATVTVAGTDKTSAIADGKLQGVKMGSEVKLKANNGYKFRKVEVKKGGMPVATLSKEPMLYNGCHAESDLLLDKGTAEGGTLMYKVTTTNVKPTSTEGFSTNNPRGVANPSGDNKNYIWYYIKGDDTHSDSEIFGPIEVTLET